MSSATTRPAGAEDEQIRGWFAIAAELQVSEKTARRLARWGTEGRCPVFEDWRGPFAMRGELDRWKRDQVLPTGIRGRLRKS